MKIFLSWSGENSESHKVAKALRKWLPKVIQQVDPWLSSHDIDSGINWSPEVDKQLAEIHFGILAITRDSMLAPWLLFEAGALSKYVNHSYVCPYLFGIKPTDLEGPLSKLQSRKSDKDGTLMLLETINKAIPDNHKLADNDLKEQFLMWWPQLDKELQDIDQSTNDSENEIRSDRDILEELLILSREQRSQQSLPKITLEPSSVGRGEGKLIDRGWSYREMSDDNTTNITVHPSVYYEDEQIT